MTQKHLKRICKYPENVIPTKEIMLEVILYWMDDVGHKDGVIETNGIRDIHSHFEIAIDYYETVFNMESEQVQV